MAFFGKIRQYFSKPLGFRWWLLVACLIALVAVILTVWLIDRYPPLDTLDELHNWVVQWTYAKTGLLGDWYYRQFIPLPQPIYDSFHIPAALLLRVIGDDLWHARLARFLLTCLSLPFIYKSGELLYGKRTGLLACVVTLFFIAPINFVRPDYGVGIMLSVGLCLFLWAHKHNRPILHFLTGLAIGLGGEGHPLAYRFGVAFALIYGFGWLRAMIREKRIYLDGKTFALGMGGLCAILIYLAIHIIPGWEQGLHFAESYSPGARIAGSQWQAAQDMIQRQSEVWQEYHPAETWIFVAGLLLAIFRFHRGDRLLLFILAVSQALMLATYGYYRAFYQIHFLPLFVLLMGKALADGFDFAPDPRPVEGRRGNLLLAGCVLIVCAFVLFNRGSDLSDPARDEFEDIGRQLAATLPPHVRVMANEDYFVTYRHDEFYGISTIATPSWFMVSLQGYPLLQATRPDVIILSPAIDSPRYVPSDSLRRYIEDERFILARCYTSTGRIEAFTYVRTLPDGWIIDATCQRYDSSEPPMLSVQGR